MEEQISAAERSQQGLRVPPSMEDPIVHAQWLDDATQEKTLLVPTQTNMQNMFDPYFWTSLDPCCFVYGDGAFGIDREVPITFPEYLEYICSRRRRSIRLRKPTSFFSQMLILWPFYFRVELFRYAN